MLPVWRVGRKQEEEEEQERRRRRHRLMRLAMMRLATWSRAQIQACGACIDMTQMAAAAGAAAEEKEGVLGWRRLHTLTLDWSRSQRKALYALDACRHTHQRRSAALCCDLCYLAYPVPDNVLFACNHQAAGLELLQSDGVWVLAEAAMAEDELLIFGGQELSRVSGGVFRYVVAHIV